MTHPRAAFGKAAARVEDLCLEDERPERERLPELLAAVAGLVALAPALFREWTSDEPDAPQDDALRPRLAKRHPSLGLHAAGPAPGAVDGPAECLLGDAIVDLRQDLHTGRLIWDRWRSDDAAGYRGSSFDVHWGEHAIELLRVLHHVVEGRWRDSERGQTCPRERCIRVSGCASGMGSACESHDRRSIHRLRGCVSERDRRATALLLHPNAPPVRNPMHGRPG